MKASVSSLDGFNPDLFQVFLCASRAHMPLSFAVHPWFVVNTQGNLTRWEILHRQTRCSTSWGHLHCNERPPLVGIDMFTAMPIIQWPGRIIAMVEGSEGSLAARMGDCIKNSPTTYSYCYRYAYTGPNSNTYVQWILNQFPDANFTLPWNAFGKGWK